MQRLKRFCRKQRPNAKRPDLGFPGGSQGGESPAGASPTLLASTLRTAIHVGNFLTKRGCQIDLVILLLH